MLKSSSFDDIFGIEATRVANGSTFNQVTGNSLDYHILNCQFVDMFSNRGSYDLVVVNGVIYFRTTHTINFLVEDCVFCGCSAGGIYFYCPNDGASVMKKICAYNCHTSLSDLKAGQFAYVTTKTNKMNEIDLVSVSHCCREISTDKTHSIYISNGNQKIIYLNSSKNKAYAYCGFSSDFSLTLNLTFTSFHDNIASSNVCIYHRISQKNNNQRYTFCNVIRNMSPSPGVFVINNDFHEHDFDFLFFIDCIFQDNQNDLFYNSNGGHDRNNIYYMLRCWIQHSGNWQNRCNNGNAFERVSCRFETSQTQTHIISFFNKDQCDPDFIYNNQLNHPCQTLQPVPPSPTTCEFEETVNLLIISNILSSLMIFSMELILIFS